MKKNIVFISLSIFIFSCQQKEKRDLSTPLKIELFKIEDTSVRAIQAVDENTMYYAGSIGDVAYTTDGGNSWNKNYIRYQDTIVPQFRSIAKNKTDIFVLSIANPALLYKITNGKKTLVYKEDHENTFYDSMAFFDDQKHGIAVGDPIEGCPSIILTSDGGNSWQKVSCELLPKFEKGEAFFAASNTNIKIINHTVWIATGGRRARILKSTDSGKSWTSYDTPILQGFQSQGIYSIDFYDENRGIVIGGDYVNPYDNCQNKAITIDGGLTWQIVSDNEDPNYKSCVQYVPKSGGKEIFAVGRTGISYSNDGGITWKDVSNDQFYTIQFVDENTAWLGGNKTIGRLRLN